MIEQWIKWEPIKGILGRYNVDAISDTIKDGFTILLKNPQTGEKIRVFFENYSASYRITNETFRLQTIHNLTKKYGSGFYGQWTFFKVNESEYIQWLLQQSAGILDNLPLIHFSFIDDDLIMDVIATYEPTVEFVPDD